jgi:hypothetical protein
MMVTSLQDRNTWGERERHAVLKKLKEIRKVEDRQRGDIDGPVT